MTELEKLSTIKHALSKAGNVVRSGGASDHFVQQIDTALRLCDSLMDDLCGPLKFKPQDFNVVTDYPMGLGMGKLEFENFAAWMLNFHISNNQPFDEPVKCTLNHDEMVAAGWITKHGGNKMYTLTPKSLGLLWIMFGKK